MMTVPAPSGGGVWLGWLLRGRSFVACAGVNREAGIFRELRLSQGALAEKEERAFGGFDGASVEAIGAQACRVLERSSVCGIGHDERIAWGEPDSRCKLHARGLRRGGSPGCGRRIFFWTGLQLGTRPFNLRWKREVDS